MKLAAGECNARRIAWDIHHGAWETEDLAEATFKLQEAMKAYFDEVIHQAKRPGDGPWPPIRKP